MKELTVIKFVLLSLALSASCYVNACDRYVSACEYFTASDAEDTVCLDSDIQQTADANCFTIPATADEMVLDCQGHRITYAGPDTSDACGPYVYNSNDDPGEWSGIYVMPGAEKVTVQNCEANNWCQGILIRGNEGVIEYNKVFDNSTGIHLQFAHRNEVQFNTAHDNERYGVRLRASQINYVHDNVIHNSGSHGIYCQNYAQYMGPANVVEDNQVNMNGANGIYAFLCDATLVESVLMGSFSYNTANKNAGNGIQLNGSDNNDVDSNTVNRNGNYGILSSDNISNSDGRNVCRQNETAPSNKPYFCK